MNNKIGSWIFWGLAFLSIPLWILSEPGTSFRHNLQWPLIYSSQMASILGTALLALTFVLSSRVKWLESWFGGIDKMYQIHHKMGLTAVILLVIHPILLALRWIPEDWVKVAEYLFPLHRRTAIDLGSWSMWGLVLLIVLTVIINVKYDKWKISHKFMGIFFILGLLHIWLLDENIMNYTPLLIYFSALSLLGVAGYIYKTFLFGLLAKSYRCSVTNINRMNDEVMEITLKPEHEKPPFIPGQFYFFSFRANSISRESHPFTITSQPESGELTIMVKALGDYTCNLYKNLKEGAQVLLEGPYGRFHFRNGGERQIWIGGGVGIAPFICWSRTLANRPESHRTIDIYYCVNTELEAVYRQEFAEIASQLNGFHFHLITAEHDGYMDISCLENLDNQDIFLCGPKPMIRRLTQQFSGAGISKTKIFYENFDFS